MLRAKKVSSGTWTGASKKLGKSIIPKMAEIRCRKVLLLAPLLQPETVP